tara:strand:+ start:8296 stop:8508 length:213 start_codon:yes stop_codon:yes gene_type:complete
MSTYTETVTLEYTVNDANNLVVRTGKITGTFSEDSAMADIQDELIERAYEREMAFGKYWVSNWSITACDE